MNISILNKKIFCIFLYLIFIIPCIYAQHYTISGYIVDKESRETIIGATVVIQGTTKGAATEIQGYFQITGVESGSYTLLISHVSYQPSSRKIMLENKSLLLDEIPLIPNTQILDEISVIGVKPNEIGDKEIETSQLQLTPKAIESIPTARNDVFKAIKYLPGVEGTEPFSPLYSVRGGDPGENRVILDGITIYNPYHFASSAGTFNVQTIKNIDLFIGGFGAEFGGSNSSILHITTKDGNKNELHGEFFPSLMSSKLLLEFPAGKNASMMLGGRYYFDIPSSFLYYNTSYFYDFNASYTNRINNKNWLAIKIFGSKDKTTYEFGKFFGYLGKSFEIEAYEDFDMGLDNHWQNFASTVYLKSILTPWMYVKNQVSYSSHKASNFSEMDMVFESPDTTDPYDIKLYYNNRFESMIRDIAFKSSVNIKIGNLQTLNAGIDYNSYYFENHVFIMDIDKGKEVREPTKLSVFAEDKIKLGPIILRPGFRYTRYDYVKDYYYEPRVNAVINFSDRFRIKAAYGTYYQYIISMNTMEYEVNQFLDYYYPLRNLKPSKSVHYIFGFEQSVYDKQLKWVTDFYYKDIERTYMFDLTQTEAESFAFSDKLVRGKGTAFGMETKIEGKIQKFSGWIGYSLAYADRSFPHIMNGKRYPYEYNRTHSFNMLINFQVNPRLSYSSTLLIMSGQPRTLESLFQNYYYYNPTNGNVDFYPTYVSDIKNNARLPMVMEWDIGVKKELRKGFGADLKELLNADASYMNITLGNILFFKRNVSWYFPTGQDKYIPIGFNYIPYINFGYILKF